MLLVYARPSRSRASITLSHCFPPPHFSRQCFSCLSPFFFRPSTRPHLLRHHQPHDPPPPPSRFGIPPRRLDPARDIAARVSRARVPSALGRLALSNFRRSATRRAINSQSTPLPSAVPRRYAREGEKVTRPASFLISILFRDRAPRTSRYIAYLPRSGNFCNPAGRSQLAFVIRCNSCVAFPLLLLNARARSFYV